MLTAVMFVLPFTLLAKSKLIQKEITVGVFQKLVVGDNIHVIIINDHHSAITLAGSPTTVASVNVEENNGTLKIGINNSSGKDMVTAFVPASELNSIEVSGNATVECQTILHGTVISVLHAGISAVKLKSDAALIQTMTTGSGRISVEGSYTNTVSRKDGDDNLIVAYSK